MISFKDYLYKHYSPHRTDAENALQYARLLKTRNKEIEDYFISELNTYCPPNEPKKHLMHGSNEPMFYSVIQYCVSIIKGRWDRFEEYIVQCLEHGIKEYDDTYSKFIDYIKELKITKVEKVEKYFLEQLDLKKNYFLNHALQYSHATASRLPLKLEIYISTQRNSANYYFKLHFINKKDVQQEIIDDNIFNVCNICDLDQELEKKYKDILTGNNLGVL